MKVGEIKHFCNCLLKNYKEHLTAKDKDDKCVYCRHHVIRRAVTDMDIRCQKEKGDIIEKAKKEYLDVIIKDCRYDEKVN